MGIILARWRLVASGSVSLAAIPMDWRPNDESGLRERVILSLMYAECAKPVAFSGNAIEFPVVLRRIFTPTG